MAASPKGGKPEDDARFSAQAGECLRQAFCLRKAVPVDPWDVADLYSPDEIARAAGVSLAEVLAVFGEERRYATQAEAVDVGRAVLSAGPMSPRLDHIPRSPSASLAVSSSLHVLVLGAMLVLTAGLVPTAAVATNYDVGHEPMRL